MKITKPKLKTLLVRPGHVKEKDFENAAKQAKIQNKRLEDVLVETGLIKDKQLGRLIADGFGFPYADLSSTKIDDDAFDMIPELVARSKGVAAFAKDKDNIKVAMLNPDDIDTIHMIEKRTGLKVIPHFATNQDLKASLVRYREDIGAKFKEILEALEDPKITGDQRDELTVIMVDTLLRYGHGNNASDIHIEPYEKKILVRFRIDGVMHDVVTLPKNLSTYITTRIKILSKMRTDEHRAAQDGRFRFKTEEEENVDVRVSVVPVTKGENIVMRLLSSAVRRFSLGNLGMDAEDLVKVNRVVRIPRGMILVAGPTGSGKTTTVYALMKILNKREVHIASIEEPVEYDIEGISQIQVNSETGLSFSQGLRSIVRQDPDIIFVGEIRDEETANIAINSAMTGHLVLSTLHADDAATTPIRFLDMGVEPYLVASTVNIVIAQRLLRKICTNCRSSYRLRSAPKEKDEIDEKKIIESTPSLMKVFGSMGYRDLSRIRLYRGKGCDVCGGSGYQGRIGVFEVLEMSDEIKELLLRRASHDEIVRVAQTQGMRTMLESGIGKVLEGVTSLEEVLRVLYE